MMLRVKFCRFAGVMCGALCVAVRGVRVVSGALMIAGFVMLAGFTMMARRVFVMFSCLLVVVRCFLRHFESPWNSNNWASRPRARVARRPECGLYAVCSTEA